MLSNFAFNCNLRLYNLGRAEDWKETELALDGTPAGPTASSSWLLQVPWGMRKTLTYVRDRYGRALTGTPAPTFQLSTRAVSSPFCHRFDTVLSPVCHRLFH